MSTMFSEKSSGGGGVLERRAMRNASPTALRSCSAPHLRPRLCGPSHRLAGRGRRYGGGGGRPAPPAGGARGRGGGGARRPRWTAGCAGAPRPSEQRQQVGGGERGDRLPALL